MLDNAIIEETNEIRSHKKGRRKSWSTWAVTAACLALLAYAGTRMLPQHSPDILLDLPLLTISEDNAGGMGFEGYIAYDISELVNGNPWRETMELTTLPVYQNRLTFDNLYVAFGVDFEAMKELLLETAGRLELDTSSLVITNNASEQEWLTREWKLHRQTLRAANTTFIWINNTISTFTMQPMTIFPGLSTTISTLLPFILILMEDCVL